MSKYFRVEYSQSYLKLEQGWIIQCPEAFCLTLSWRKTAGSIRHLSFLETSCWHSLSQGTYTVYYYIVYTLRTTMSVPSSKLGPPPPSPASECGPHRNQKGEVGTPRLRVRGWRSPNFDDWSESLALCLLCGVCVMHWNGLLILNGSGIQYKMNHICKSIEPQILSVTV